METFYVGSEGDVMNQDQVEKQDPTFFDNPRSAKYLYGQGRYATPAPPPDEPGSDVQSFTFDTRLANLAKQDFEDADPENIRKLGTLMYGDPSILRNVTFTDKDLAILVNSCNLYPNDLVKMGICDKIIEEPNGGAHRDIESSSQNLKSAILSEIKKLETVDPLSFIDLRIQKYDKLGVYEDLK